MTEIRFGKVAQGHGVLMKGENIIFEQTMSFSIPCEDTNRLVSIEQVPQFPETVSVRGGVVDDK